MQSFWVQFGNHRHKCLVKVPSGGKGDKSLLIVSVPTISVQLAPMVYSQCCQAILCYNVYGGVERHKEVSFGLK